MKKYVKPTMLYERYELSHHIADCAWEWVNALDEKTCNAVADSEKLPHYAGPDYVLFTSQRTCTLLDEDLEDLCYHNGMANVNVFNS